MEKRVAASIRPGKLGRNELRPYKTLLGAKGDDRVDGGGAASGEIASNERDEEKEEGYDSDGGEIAWGEAEEHAGDKAGGSDGRGDADGYAEHCERERFSQDKPENILALRTDGDANADFAGAARDGVGHQAVEADGGKEKSKNGEES